VKSVGWEAVKLARQSGAIRLAKNLSASHWEMIAVDPLSVTVVPVNYLAFSITENNSTNKQKSK
jgi:hypothetical protein